MHFGAERPLFCTKLMRKSQLTSGRESVNVIASNMRQFPSALVWSGATYVRLAETCYRPMVTSCALTVTDVAVAGNSGTMTVIGDFAKIAIKSKLS